MRRPSDIPRVPRKDGGNGRRIGISLIVAVVVVAVSLFKGAAVFYTDYLWFGSVDLKHVWATLLGTKIALGALATLFFFLVLWINLWVVERFAPRNILWTQEDELAKQFSRFIKPRVGRVRAIAAGVLALFGGLGFYTHWQDWILFRNGGSFGLKDPQFNKDVSFFVFKLPFLTAVVQWIFYALLFALIVSVVVHYLRGAIRPQAATARVTAAVKAHVSILLGLLALVRAGQYYLDRYRLSFSGRGVVTGANYTDVNFLLPAYALLILISAFVAVLFFVGARSKSWTWPTATVALWAGISLLVVSVIPIGVQKLSVEPAESTKERPFIQRNIDSTREAIGLKNVEVKDFAYTDQLNAQSLQENAQTIRNVRLWDPVYLKPSYKRLQESRSFFQLADIDIDRYKMNGEVTQTMLAVRELNIAGLPQERRSWVNQHLAFTHGYGAVASPSNAVTSNGEPDFIVKDLPPVGSPSITRPQVYFGEHTSDYSIVGSKQGEVDYTAADGRDQTSRYEGSGGVKLDSIVKKAAFAARVGDLSPLISDLVTPSSRAMYLTNIRERAIKAAPFLTYDNDPYPVLVDGRILWMQDAYTTTKYFPYGQRANTSQVDGNSLGGSLKNIESNYIRNSVKIVTDAYDGTMTFYVTDQSDPIIKAWQKAFPKLFVDGSTMPQNIQEHKRYPEDLFRVQSTMFGQYHLTDAQDFYSNADRWNIAQKPGASVTSTTTRPPNATPVAAGAAAPVSGEERIEPYYLLMRLPNEQDEQFLMFQPFVPFSQRDERKELSAFLTAKSDPADYGKLQAYVMPRGQQVDGPALVEAKIQQNPDISSYITLLSRAGSTVGLGNMLIIPVNNSLLYVRPLYVQAQSTNVPEFKKAIVVQGQKIAMGDTLQQALSTLFGSAPPTLEEAPNPGQNPTTPSEPGTTPTTSTPTPGQGQSVQQLLDQANEAFAAADTALRNGDLAGYQANVQKGADLVKQARGQS